MSECVRLRLKSIRKHSVELDLLKEKVRKSSSSFFLSLFLSFALLRWFVRQFGANSSPKRVRFCGRPNQKLGQVSSAERSSLLDWHIHSFVQSLDYSHTNTRSVFIAPIWPVRCFLFLSLSLFLSIYLFEAALSAAEAFVVTVRARKLRLLWTHKSA